MRNSILLIVACVGVLAASPGAAGAAGSPRPQAASSASPATEHRALVDSYCVGCHNPRLRTGGLDLSKLDLAKVGGGAATWEKVARKLRIGAMPPIGARRPDKPVIDAFAAWLEGELDQAAAVAANPGRTEALHRLNRTEYQNAIRDLLALDVDVAELLPVDDSSYGFDTIAGVLGVSPTLMERYLGAARKISHLALAASVRSPTAETFRVRSDLPQNDRFDGLPFGTRGGIRVRFNFPQDAEYLIKVETRGDASDVDLRIGGQRLALSAGTVAGAAGTDPGLEARTVVKAGPRDVTVALVKKASTEAESLLQPFLSTTVGPTIGSVTIVGPFAAMEGQPREETPSRRRILTCRPPAGSDGVACARQILSTLTRRAYRRPVTRDDVDALLAFYREGRGKGGFEAGIELALRRILVGPEFLFRAVASPPATSSASYRISDFDLASRLSFFLWSSIPDDELLDVAAKGLLKDPAVLERQVRRMLADARSQALVQNFAGQWLSLRLLTARSPDIYLFPDFDEGLRQAFRTETELFVESVLRENRSVLDLLSANYTFVNERLARHYGIPEVYGTRFRRVTLSDPRRGGLLGQGGILTVTSHANRTAPVLRGKWILENLLGVPPPAPPPNVPDLKDKNSQGKVLSMRERMVQHRANPVCATCHAVMDPLGLSLENFNAVGQWRAHGESGEPIDASATLMDGTKFEGAAGLRQALLNRPEQFVTTLTERLLIYALGRGVEYYDAPVVRSLVRESKKQDYRFSDVILGIVKSKPFQMRRSQP